VIILSYKHGLMLTRRNLEVGLLAKPISFLGLRVSSRSLFLFVPRPNYLLDKNLICTRSADIVLELASRQRGINVLSKKIRKSTTHCNVMEITSISAEWHTPRELS
jgi:hypothetical protein